MIFPSKACLKVLPVDYDPIYSKNILKMIAVAETGPVSLEVTIASHWIGKQRLAAWGYHVTCYQKRGDERVKVAGKDWSDDGESYRVGTLALSRFEAVKQCLARVIPIATALGSPSLRVYTESTWTSAIVKPQKGYRLNLPIEYRETTLLTRNILKSYEGFPDRVFSRGTRVAERLAEGGTPHTRRFGHIRRRLRNRVDPDRIKDQTFWIDLRKVQEHIEYTPTTGRRANFQTALMHYLRDVKEIPAKVIEANTGVKVGQINRSANAFRDSIIIDDDPNS